MLTATERWILDGDSLNVITEKSEDKHRHILAFMYTYLVLCYASVTNISTFNSLLPDTEEPSTISKVTEVSPAMT